ncbi:uroporphyrinogen-III synthase [Octadecabacter sp. G9-8]|uniref:Uroporphyrinogen-III synthase n=1 Tax=Octadecabacter dasysiphoniae TaxID=2909341 RepID=A0ABS9CZM3_9RHOB|nr:uroporphyrinogen-III synthase [Octadecabacter dasysiphoniae]MCF2871518.1 uroporphyrinogen-III synthase [Octadecabacter dasysiphoniae]
MTLPPYVHPTVLITRPRVASERFSVALARVAGPFRPLIVPAFELVATGARIPDFEAAVFTSRAGVAFAPKGNGRVAYCVGDATADAARQAGYTAISAGGSAQDLCAVILARGALEKLVHIRGEVSIGDVSTVLTSGGLVCAEIVAYRKDVVPVDGSVLGILQSVEHLIFPVFSAETVSILIDWQFDFSGAHVVTISDSVGEAAVGMSPASITVSDHPNLQSMVAQTAGLIA